MMAESCMVAGAADYENAEELQAREWGDGSGWRAKKRPRSVGSGGGGGWYGGFGGESGVSPLGVTRLAFGVSGLQWLC